MPEAPDNSAPDIEVLLNKRNVVLARGQKLVQSWRKSAQTLPASGVEEADEEDDGEPMTDHGGIGSKSARFGDDDTATGLALPRKPTTSKDKLLEQILGTKRAREMRKRDAEATKHASTSRHSASKPIGGAQKRPVVEEQESEDEVGGRATAFKSRKR